MLHLSGHLVSFSAHCAHQMCTTNVSLFAKSMGRCSDLLVLTGRTLTKALSFFLPPLIAVNQGISSDSIYDDGPEYTDAVPLVGKANRRGRATAPAVGRGLFDYVQVRVCYEPTRTNHKISQKIRCFTSHSFFALCMLQQPV